MPDIDLDNAAQFIVDLFRQVKGSIDSLEHILLQNDFLPTSQSRISHSFEHKSGLKAGILQRNSQNTVSFQLIFVEFIEGESFEGLSRLYDKYLPEFIETKISFISLLEEPAKQNSGEEDLDGSRYKFISAFWDSGIVELELVGGFGGPEDGFSLNAFVVIRGK